MISNDVAHPISTGHPGASETLGRLKAALDHASHLLPAQGPISVFIHHNTLHAFEEFPFREATEKAAGVFGCEPYPTEARFHIERGKGRILDDDLRAALADDLGPTGADLIAPGVSRTDLRMAMLTRPIWVGTPAELRWKVAEEDIPQNGTGLWERCLKLVRDLPNPLAEPSTIRVRRSLVDAGGSDPDLLVHDLLARYSAAFIDQGMARLPLPGKEKGFLRGFSQLYSCGGAEPWHHRLAPLCRQVSSAGTDPIRCILDSLGDLGIAEVEWGEFLSATLLALRGWGGMIYQVEHRPDSVHHAIPTGSFVEFVAVRLLMDRAAAAHLAEEDFGYTGTLAALRPWLAGRRITEVTSELELRVYGVYQAARAAGISAVSEEMAREVLGFTDVKRRWIFQQAFERRFRIRALDALAYRFRHPATLPAKPRFQLITCLDEREESFRRHLEEVAPDCETFATAGFFAVVMYYRGAAGAHFTPLCPVVVHPKHWVEERPLEALEESDRRTRRYRRALGNTSHRFHVGTRGFAVGALLTAGVGVLATFPLVARVLFPRLTAHFRRRAESIVQPPKKTRLRLERTDPKPGPEAGGLGFSVEEMTGIAERVLRDIGLTRNFSRLVFTLGHGSHSMNNPHESAHDCGACGGAVGGPNGRAIAQILNDQRIRAGLLARGLVIPDDTVFVGGLHNTCNEYVKFADTDLIPESHRAAFDIAHEQIEAAIARNAHERARRFDSAPLDITPAAARQHMDDRAEDLAQVRPEWGHATNAYCVVGRRARTRGLYLDRRPFLVSYDPTQDDVDGAILARTLAAVFPVCAGINLEYYFSHIDPIGYGAGTKLPHNITSLLGVMDGAASDLRTGLPWQMTEIHEPIRLLIVIETTVAIMEKMMRDNPANGAMARNGWVQVALMHPETGAISVFERGEFRPYTPVSQTIRRVHTSHEWYAGKRDHLEFVEVAQEIGGGRP